VAKKKSTPPTADSEEKLAGPLKAAILLLALEPDSAATVLKHLHEDIVEVITREIASLDLVDQKQRGKVVEEFYHIALARKYAETGGLGYAKVLLEKALPRDDAARILQQIEHQVYQQPFAFLQKTDGENLPPAKASEILVGLPQAKQLEVVSRVANMDQTNPEMIKEVERGLEMRLQGLVSQTFEKAGGVEAVAEMLNLADRSTEKGILEALEAEDPDLVEQIRRLMFVFEDIMLINDKGVQAVLKEIDNDELSLALRTANAELKEKIFKNMSERAAQLIQEDMEYMGPVRLSDVEAAQQRIVDVVRRLEDAGEIIISGRGGEKDLIV